MFLLLSVTLESTVICLGLLMVLLFQQCVFMFQFLYGNATMYLKFLKSALAVSEFIFVVFYLVLIVSQFILAISKSVLIVSLFILFVFYSIFIISDYILMVFVSSLLILEFVAILLYLILILSHSNLMLPNNTLILFISSPKFLQLSLHSLSPCI